jgi:hypothetical protein
MSNDAWLPIRLTTWSAVSDFLRGKPRGSVVRVRRPTGKGFPWEFPGMVRSNGSPRGQIADYRLVGSDGGGLHIREYGDRYECHYDRCDPSVSLSGHLRLDVFK